MERTEAIDLATQHLATLGRKRAAVFAVIAQSLHDGPAKVPYVVIARRYIRHPNRTFVANVYRDPSKIDAITEWLRAEGWLVLVEDVPGRPRVWDLGPAVDRLYAPVAARKRFARSLAGAGERA